MLSHAAVYVASFIVSIASHASNIHKTKTKTQIRKIFSLIFLILFCSFFRQSSTFICDIIVVIGTQTAASTMRSSYIRFTFLWASQVKGLRVLVRTWLACSFVRAFSAKDRSHSKDAARQVISSRLTELMSIKGSRWCQQQVQPSGVSMWQQQGPFIWLMLGFCRTIKHI